MSQCDPCHANRYHYHPVLVWRAFDAKLQRRYEGRTIASVQDGSFNLRGGLARISDDDTVIAAIKACVACAGSSMKAVAIHIAFGDYRVVWRAPGSSYYVGQVLPARQGKTRPDAGKKKAA